MACIRTRGQTGPRPRPAPRNRIERAHRLRPADSCRESSARSAMRLLDAVLSAFGVGQHTGWNALKICRVGIALIRCRNLAALTSQRRRLARSRAILSWGQPKADWSIQEDIFSI